MNRLLVNIKQNLVVILLVVIVIILLYNIFASKDEVEIRTTEIIRNNTGSSSSSSSSSSTNTNTGTGTNIGTSSLFSLGDSIYAKTNITNTYTVPNATQSNIQRTFNKDQKIGTFLSTIPGGWTKVTLVSPVEIGYILSTQIYTK